MVVNAVVSIHAAIAQEEFTDFFLLDLLAGSFMAIVTGITLKEGGRGRRERGGGTRQKRG